MWRAGSNNLSIYKGMEKDNFKTLDNFESQNDTYI